MVVVMMSAARLEIARERLLLRRRQHGTHLALNI